MTLRGPTVVRFLVHAGAFLLVGVIFTAALAWVCAQWNATSHANGTRIQMEGGYINLEHHRGFGVERIDWFAAKGGNSPERTWELKEPYPEWVPDWSTVRTLNVGVFAESGVVQVNQTAYGWPVFAFRNLERSGRAIDWRNRAAKDVDAEPPDDEGLAVLWPGFALNTLLFGGGIWLIFFAPFQLQRALRRKLNLCPHCAYPIGTSDLCSECGKPVN